MVVVVVVVVILVVVVQVPRVVVTESGGGGGGCGGCECDSRDGEGVYRSYDCRGGGGGGYSAHVVKIGRRKEERKERNQERKEESQRFTHAQENITKPDQSSRPPRPFSVRSQGTKETRKRRSPLA